MDYGHSQTDKILSDLEQRIANEYRTATREVEKKLTDHLNAFDEKDKKQKEKLKKGEITQEQYKRWRAGQMVTGKHWEDMRDILATDLSNSNQIATNMINEHTVDIYALNANYGCYEICKGTNLNLSFELYDHSTVERLMRENPEIIPKAKVDIPKDMRWNRQKLTSAITQGVLTGEPIPDIAKRLRSVADMNHNASVRNARTYTTAAENGGRVDSYKRAKAMGIDLKQEWNAVLDLRTRTSHRHLDGEKIEVGGKFSNGCRYPGDPEGRPWEIYNCRCTLVAADPLFEKEDAESYKQRFSRLPEGMTYEEWKRGKEKESKKSDTSVFGLTRPQRPRQGNYGGYTEAFQKAREEYRLKLNEYNNAIDKAIKNSADKNVFSTKDQLKKWANEKGIEIDPEVFNRIDLRSFNETKSVLEEMFDKYPEVKGYQMEDFGGRKVTSRFGIGITDDGLLSANNGLNFNPRLFSDYENGLRSAFEQLTDGTLVRGDGTFGTLIRHEYGHNVQEYVETKLRDKYHMTPDDWRLNYSKFEEYKEAQEKYKKEREQYEKELYSLAGLNGSSDYSNTNTLELFAEGFAEYTSGSKSEFGKKFGEFLKRWY